MADIWRVSRSDIDLPIIMKVPFLDFESDIALLVGFEVEQMIMAELKGPHVPRWIANGDYAVQPYIVMEYVAPARRFRTDARIGPCPPTMSCSSASRSRPPSPTCTSSTCSTLI